MSLLDRLFGNKTLNDNPQEPMLQWLARIDAKLAPKRTPLPTDYYVVHDCYDNNYYPVSVKKWNESEGCGHEGEMCLCPAVCYRVATLHDAVNKCADKGGF